MPGKFTLSWELAKESLEVIRRSPSLIWFPVISGVTSLILTVSFAIPVFLATGGKGLEHINPYVGYPLMGLFYFITYFAVIFFNSGLVACAHESLQGRTPTFSDGLSMAARRLPAILGWTAIAATVGMVLQLVGERTGFVGRIVVAILGAAWNLVTAFAVPVIVIEQGSPIQAVKRSAAMLKQTWGENLIGTGGISLVIIAAALSPVVPVVLAFCFLPPAVGFVLAGLTVLYWLALAVIGSSLQGVYTTALFVYAQTGQVPGGFTPAFIEGAYRTRPPSALARLKK